MKLWLILYVGTQIGGTWGPLPYDMKECEIRAAERQASIDKMVATGLGEKGTKIPPDMLEKLKTWRVACEYRDTRPPLSSE